MKFFIRFIVSFASVTLVSCHEGAKVNNVYRKVNPGSNSNSAASPKAELTERPRAAPVLVNEPDPNMKRGYIADTSQVSQYIRQICQDDNENLWFGTVGDGVCRYDGDTLTYFTPKEGFCGTSVQAILQEKNGLLWFGTEQGISSFNGSVFRNFTEQDGLSHKHVMSMLIDKSGQLWVGTIKGVCKLQIEDNNKISFVPFPFPGGDEKMEVFCMMQDRSGNMWFGSRTRGVYCLSSGRFRHFSKKELGSDFVSSIFQDKKGIIWFATSGGGLCRYDPIAELSQGLSAFSNCKEEKGSNEIYRVYEDRSGNLWFAFRGGIRCIKAGESWAGSNTKYKSYSAPEGLTNCCIQSILEDTAGNFWCGSGAGLFLLNNKVRSGPCASGSCSHNLNDKDEIQLHQKEVAQVFINIKKRAPWPIR